MNSKFKKLLGDAGLFTISNMGSKLVVFLLVPLYTSVLSDADYGIADLITGTNNLLVPLLTLSISEAVLRFPFDKDKSRGVIFGGALTVALSSIALVGLLSPILTLFDFELRDFWYWIPTLFATTVLNTVFAAYVRSTGRLRSFALKGLLQTVVMVGLNLIFLLPLDMGLMGYMLSLVISEAVAVLFMLLYGKTWRELPEIKCERRTLREMLAYSIPMIPTVLAWWVMQLSDKYVVIAFWGLAASGIYAVAYKIPSILSTLITIFTQAWQISAFENSGEEDYSDFVTTVYRYFWIVNALVCALLIAASKPLGYILYQKEFFEAWRYVPVLLIAYLFMGVSGLLASIFSAAKRTGVLFHSSAVGAVLNIVLNLIFVPAFGVMAAAVTTLVGFLVTWGIRLISSRKFVKIKVSIVRDIASLLVLGAEAVAVVLDWQYKYIACAVALVVILAIYGTALKNLFRSIVKRKLVR